MNATELTTLSMSELKAFCTSHAIEVVGDKRSKSTYILAIETFQSEQTIIEMPATPDPFDDAIEVDQSIDLPPVHTTQHQQASVVVLIPLILLSLAIISIRIGIGALIPLIGSLLRFMGVQSRYV